MGILTRIDNPDFNGPPQGDSIRFDDDIGPFKSTGDPDEDERRIKARFAAADLTGSKQEKSVLKQLKEAWSDD